MGAVAAAIGAGAALYSIYQGERQRREMKRAMKRAEQERKRREAQLRLQEERARERALARLAEAKENIREATSKALGELQVQQAVGRRIAERAAAVAGFTTAGLADVLRKYQEAFGTKVLGLQRREAEALARISGMEAEVEAQVPLQFAQLINQLSALEASYLQAQAAMMQAQPPSLFDRLIGVGSTIALFSLLAGQPAGGAGDV